VLSEAPSANEKADFDRVTFAFHLAPQESHLRLPNLGRPILCFNQQERCAYDRPAPAASEVTLLNNHVELFSLSSQVSCVDAEVVNLDQQKREQRLQSAALVGAGSRISAALPANPG